jgi:hypothetical protein
MDNLTREQILDLIGEYVGAIELELSSRWERWPLDLSKAEMFETIGALMARMVSLATELAVAPQIWNEHIAPIILRSMADAYINLAWIFNEPVERSRKFILYGLGQAKLEIEHRKAQLQVGGINPEDDPVVKRTEWWINTQHYTFLTEVNLGNWAGIDTRKMAEEAGCIDFYNYVYSPFSAATHNSWQHISRYNLLLCSNPLHGLHYVPSDPDLGSHISYFQLAAKYANKAFRLFDEKTGVKSDAPSSYKILLDFLREFEKSDSTE